MLPCQAVNLQQCCLHVLASELSINLCVLQDNWCASLQFSDCHATMLDHMQVPIDSVIPASLYCVKSYTEPKAELDLCLVQGHHQSGLH